MHPSRHIPGFKARAAAKAAAAAAPAKKVRKAKPKVAAPKAALIDRLKKGAR